jgi:hypothetical protein
MNPSKEGDSKQPPQPDRFVEFKLLKDETGFTIPGSNHIFYFDVYGGWFDEYKNYYNSNGEPRSPPDYSSGDDDEAYEHANRLADEYADVADDDEDHLDHYDSIYLNAENKTALGFYLKDQEIHIKVRNVHFKYTEDDFEEFLRSKKIEWIVFDYEYDNRDRFNGVVHISLDLPNAEKFIELNGYKLWKRDLKISVQKPEIEDEVAGGSPSHNTTTGKGQSKGHEEHKTGDTK